jgi:nucleotidyltransferase/DNA polymerase involved in DNA repair
MPISEAWRRAGANARYVPPRFSRYHEKSMEVFALLARSAATVEPASIDEAYLDLSDAPTFAEAIDRARALQERIHRECGITASLGVAASKLVAKIATDLRKPNGLTAVTPGTEEEFLAPLPARKIPGVGPKTEERLKELGIETCEQLAAAPEPLLAREFGAWGPRLAQLARGLDDSPVEVGWERKSLGSETTFDRDETDPAEWERTLRALGEEIGASLREERRKGRTVTLKVRLSGFETHTRARTLAAPTAEGALLGAVAVELLREFAPDRPLRLLGVRVTSLVEEDGSSVQATLRDWPADVLGEAEAWEPRQRRLDGYG